MTAKKRKQKPAAPSTEKTPIMIPFAVEPRPLLLLYRAIRAASPREVLRASAASATTVAVVKEACSIGRYDCTSVVGGRTACSGSCGNMAVRSVWTADAVQQRRRCDGAGALPAGAAAGVVLVLVKEPVVARNTNDASIQRRGSRVWVVGDARQFTGVAGDKIAM
jgi:hypothetical protein